MESKSKKHFPTWSQNWLSPCNSIFYEHSYKNQQIYEQIFYEHSYKNQQIN